VDEEKRRFAWKGEAAVDCHEIGGHGRLELLRDWVEVVARAGRSAEVAVAHDPHPPENPVVPHQPDQRVDRRPRRRARLEVAIESDADAAGVVALDVGADGPQGAAPVDAAAREDDEVVANVDPALRLVLALNRPEPRGLLLLRRRPRQGRVDGVMDDDLEGPLRDPAAGRRRRSPLLPRDDPALRYEPPFLLRAATLGNVASSRAVPRRRIPALRRQDLH
jgi:hypothetical protein